MSVAAQFIATQHRKRRYKDLGFQTNDGCRRIHGLQDMTDSFTSSEPFAATGSTR